MALNLKVADLYADMKINMAAFDASMARMKAQFAAIKAPTINPTINAGKVLAGLDSILSKLTAIKKASVVSVGFGTGPAGAAGGAARNAVPSNFVPLSSVQMAGIGLQDRIQAQYEKTVAASRKAADAQIADDARVQTAHQRSVAAQVAAATKVSQARVRAARQAADAQIAAQAASRRQFGSGLSQGLGGPFLGSGSQAAGLAIGTSISLMTDGIKASAETAIDLQAKFAEVRRVAGLSADETDRLKHELMAISTIQPGVTLDDLIKMADIGSRMGIAGRDLTTFASGLAMVKNSVADMDTESLANNMSRVLNVFHLGPEYVKGFGSALTAMDNASTASASDILKITQGLSGTASAIGVTLPQVIALSAALRDVGLTNAVASGSMSQVFRKMATNADEFAAAAGVDAKQFADAYRKGPMEALSMLMRKLNETKDTIQTQELLKSLGLEGVRTGGALLQLAQAFDRVAPLARTANTEFTTLKSLLDADGLKGETAAASLGKLDNAVKGAADGLGSILTPAIKGVSDELAEFIARGAKAIGLMQQFGGGGGLNAAQGAIMQQQFRLFLNGGNPLLAGLPGWLGAMQGGPAAATALPKPAVVTAGLGSGGATEATFKEAQKGFADSIGKRITGALSGPGAVLGIYGKSLATLGQQLKASLQHPDSPSASVGVSASEFGRLQQQQVLDSTARDTAKNTQKAADILGQMYQLMQRAKSNTIGALLGP